MLECDVVRDLLPLYAEQMVSDRTAALVSEHLNNCPPCAENFALMTQPQPDVQFRTDSANQFVRYQKKQKMHFGVVVAAVAAAVGAMLMSLVMAVIVSMTAFGTIKIHEEMQGPLVDRDIANYRFYMGEDADADFQVKSTWNVNESVFPAEITPEMQVQDYQMTYYNPFDPQYISYLTVQYTPEDFAAECSRLAEIGTDDYQGIYGVTGFPGGEPLAVSSDDYSGFVYAIRTPGQENTVTYCELLFCNNAFDLDYTEYIPAEYLPEGFTVKIYPK